MSKLRIGRITYTNIWPIYHFFNDSKFKDLLDLIPQVPSQLNEQMKNGLIDMGPISAFAYAEQADEYALLPNLSVSAFGRVGSISLFLKKGLNIEKAKNKKIALTNTSATSVNLLKVIVEGFFKGTPEYITMEPDLEKMMKVADLALLIGDEALTTGWKNDEDQQYEVIDLGTEWLKHTNHWMTFAVWAVRKEVIINQPELLYKVYEEFISSKKLGNQRREIIVDASQKRFGGNPIFWKQYFDGLSYDFGKDQINGLNKYYQMAEQIGVLKKAPKIEVIDFEKWMIPSK